MARTAREAALRNLTDAMYETLALFDAPAAALARSYAPGKWTLRELVLHLSDAETVLLDRLRRIAAEVEPPLASFDQDLWVKHLCPATRDLALARQQFEVARRNVIELGRLLPAKTDTRRGNHSEVGAISFAQVFAKVLNHNMHHLQQARAILAGKTWKPAKK
jgi:hypothetical protein